MQDEQSRELDAIHHIAITVNNVAEAVAWYSTHFRCRVAYHDETWALLKFANTALALVGGGLHPPHIGLMLPGANRFGPLKTHRDGIQYVYINDPSGNTVEVLEQQDEQ